MDGRCTTRACRARRRRVASAAARRFCPSALPVTITSRPVIGLAVSVTLFSSSSTGHGWLETCSVPHRERCDTEFQLDDARGRLAARACAARAEARVLCATGPFAGRRLSNSVGRASQTPRAGRTEYCPMKRRSPNGPGLLRGRAERAVARAPWATTTRLTGIHAQLPDPVAAKWRGPGTRVRAGSAGAAAQTPACRARDRRHPESFNWTSSTALASARTGDPGVPPRTLRSRARSQPRPLASPRSRVNSTRVARASPARVVRDPSLCASRCCAGSRRPRPRPRLV